MPKIVPPKIDVPVDGSVLHDIDWFWFQTNYEYEGFVPMVDGETLNHMFPKGWDKNMPEGANREEYSKKFYLAYLEWRRVIQIISEQWDYKNLPDYLDKYVIEKMLLENGQCVWFWDPLKEEYYLLPYSGGDYDVYGRPVNIKITTQYSSRFDGHAPKEFVVWKDTEDGIQIFNKVIQAITARNDVIQELRKNLRAAAPKGIFVDTYSTDDRENKGLTKMLDSIVKSDQNFFAMKVNKDTFEQFTASARANSNGQIYFPIELRDRTAELIDQASYWTQWIQQWIGLEVDYNMDKGERKIVNEVSTQQGMSRGINLHRFNQRKIALEKINKKYGLNIQIEWNNSNEKIFVEDSEMIEEELIDNEN